MIIAAAGLFVAAASATTALAGANDWSDISAGTATAYCLAKHTGVAAGPNGYSADGFEVATGYFVGAVRRNYVFDRPMQSPGAPDAGQGQSCEQACAQMGKLESALVGSALKYAPGGATPEASGLGDHASIAMFDYDYYKDKSVVSGFWVRPQTFESEDVAQADHCCCQLGDRKQ
jgi:hypothetical protein